MDHGVVLDHRLKTAGAELITTPRVVPAALWR